MKEESSPSVKLIFDQKAPAACNSSRSSSSSSDSSVSSSRDSHSSSRSRRSSRDRRRSRSSSSSSSRSRSRSHPRCRRASSRSRCHHRHRSPPRRYRAHSRSYSPSPDRSSRRSRSPSPYRNSRRSSRSPVHWRGGRFVGRYRCRFNPSPDRYRSHRSQSRSQERNAIRLSQAEKKCLLDIAKANAARILGVQHLELPASLKDVEEEKSSSSVKEERFRDDPAQVNDDDGGEGTSHTLPKTKPITFSINNTVAKPSNSPTLNDSKVTSRADSVADRKPYGQWIPIGKASKNKH